NHFTLSSPRKRGPIFQRPGCLARWVPAFAGTTKKFFTALVIAGALIAHGAAPAAAQNFYAGRQLTLICGAAVGGGYDALARLLARHLGRLIPGNPTVIVQNMPAAGSLVAANQIYNAAPKDGSVISLIQRGMLTSKLINPAQTRFDVARLNWIGSLASEVGVVAAWHTAPHKSAKDLFDKELIVGGHAGGDPELPDLPNALDFAKSDAERKILQLYFTQKTAARPVIAPPGIPAERLAILRTAFAALASDRDFLADAEKSSLDVDPMPGEEVD